MLRLANDQDHEVVLNLVKTFFSQTKYGHRPLDEEGAKDTVVGFLQSDNREKICLLWEEEGKAIGILAGQIHPLPFLGAKIAMECLWWVDPYKRGSEAGVQLLDAFEYWATLQGADFLQMMSMPDRTGKLLDRFYRNRGYTLTEIAYTKELK